MQIVIGHLTRMEPGYICVAGIEPDTARHVRPVLHRRRLTRDLLRKEGGVFEIGALVDLGPTKGVGHAPELEDHEFSTENLRYLYRLKPGDFWKYLIESSQKKLTAIFGDELKQRGRSCTVDIDTGKASLGNLGPEKISYFGVNTWDNWDKIRIQISDGELDPDLSVTDVRLYKSDQQTARRRIVESVAGRLRGTGVVLSVGLTRAWRKSGETAPRHWLQVNNIHLEEDPLGEIFQF